MRDAMSKLSSVGVLLMSALALSGCAAPGEPPVTSRELTTGWRIQAVAKVVDGGEVVSTPGYDVEDWVATAVPTTVMAALVADGSYPDMYVGINIENVPTEQFRGPWWYRTEFELSAQNASGVASLVLDGINYSADVWLNGEKLGSRDEVQGAFLVHELDVTGRVRAGANALAIEVHPPEPGQFTIGFVDWNPHPPDENMGVWRPVTLRLTGEVSLREVYITGEVDLETLRSADLEVSMRLVNHSENPLTATVRGSVDGREFRRDVDLDPLAERRVIFGAVDVPELHLESARLWWPHNLGEPNLYSLELSAEVGGRISDRSETTFGVREISTYLNDEGHRGFAVNGKPVLIRGGGWVDDLLLSDSEAGLEAQLSYVKHMNLNTVRLEGFWGTSHAMFDIADRLGLLVMVGWSCQWEWEEYLGGPVDELYGGVTTAEEIDLVANSLRDQVVWLRNHPSVFTWVLASDMLPHPDAEREYNAVLAEVDPTRPPLVSCAWVESEVSGPSGVKMSGPYDWVPPLYWWEDREHGGAYGFNTETGPGPQPPPLESLERMIPAENLWPIDEVWHFHCARNEFNTPDRYVEALSRRYGRADSVEEFLARSQVASYEAIRPMFEAFGAHRPSTTGVIQWMLNSAWPAMFWQLYDHYLMPNGAFYGTRAACQPVNLVYDYSTHTVHAVNDTLTRWAGAKATVRGIDLAAQEYFNETRTVDLAANASSELLSLADVQPPTPVWFLDLRLADASGAEMARNFYWLSTEPDVLDYEASEWFVTPTGAFADFTALDELPEVDLEASATVTTEADVAGVTVRLRNPSDHLAFAVELRIVDPETDRSILPVLLDDNYVSLLPDEERELTAHFPQTDDVSGAVIKIAGWNVAAQEIQLASQ
jgi:exo-1,4-beta-D-glucosaminidase